MCKIRLIPIFGVLFLLASLSGTAVAGFTVTPGQWHIAYQRAGKLAFLTYAKKGEKTACLSGDFQTVIKARVLDAGCQISTEKLVADTYALTGSCYVKQLGSQVDVSVTAVMLTPSKITLRMTTLPGASLRYSDTSVVTYVGASCDS